jgi:hypothetical protein
MRHAAIIALLLGSLLPAAANAQEPSDAEKATLGEIAKCLIVGLPKDWRQAEMTVALASPSAESGEARYHFRRNLAGGEYETFAPCDFQAPARARCAAQGPAGRARRLDLRALHPLQRRQVRPEIRLSQAAVAASPS